MRPMHGSYKDKDVHSHKVCKLGCELRMQQEIVNFSKRCLLLTENLLFGVSVDLHLSEMPSLITSQTNSACSLGCSTENKLGCETKLAQALFGTQTIK